MTKLISWVEIPALDFERAVKFYSSVLKIELQTIDCGEEKMACFPGGEGAISFAPDFKPGKDGADYRNLSFILEINRFQQTGRNQLMNTA